MCEVNKGSQAPQTVQNMLMAAQLQPFWRFSEAATPSSVDCRGHSVESVNTHLILVADENAIAPKQKRRATRLLATQ